MDSEFFSELKQLNEDFLTLIKSSLTESLFFDLTPTLKDYIRQFDEIDKKYPRSSNSTPLFNLSSNFNFTKPSTFSFGSASNMTNQSKIFNGANVDQAPDFNKTTTFSFGASTNIANQSKLFNGTNVSQTPEFIKPSTFSFGTPSNLPFQNKTINTASISQGTNISTATVPDGDDAEETTPPEPNVDKYEEPDAKFQVRCKLYERGKVADGTASINLLGFGVLFVKQLETAKKLQVIFRQDPDLRKVLLNEVVTPQIPIKQISKTVQMLIPGPSGETKFFFAKVKEESDATQLYEILKFIK